MFKKQHLNKRWRERGNIFFTLFAAVGVVGAIGVGSMTLLKGPVQTMVRSNQQTVIDNKSELNLRVMINDILQSTPDCDGDDTIEAAEWQTPLLGEPIPIGGGLFPDIYGTNITDPWGSRFGYCVWDHGALIDDPACGGPTQNRLRGPDDSQTAPALQPFITVISAGPNKQFETSCIDYVDLLPGPPDLLPDDPLITRVANSDDQINVYNYQDTRNTMGDNWVFESNNPADDDAAKTTQNLEFEQNVTFNGLLDMSRLGGGLTLPDIAGGISCGPSNEGDLFRDSASTPPALVMCQSGAFVAVAGDGAGGGDIVIPDPNFDPHKANCLVNNNGPLVLEKTLTFSSNPLDVWVKGNYLFIPLGSDGLRVYNRITLTEIPVTGGPTFAYGIHIDDNDIIHTVTGSNAGGQIQAWRFDGSTLTGIDSENFPGWETRNVTGEGSYLYTSDVGGNGLTALTFDGSIYTIAESSGFTPNGIKVGIKAKNGYLFYYENPGTNYAIGAFSFDGTNFSDADGGTAGNQPYRQSEGSAIQDMFITEDHIYIANRWGGIEAYTFNGTTFTSAATRGGPPDGNYGIWTDGAVTIVGDATNGIDTLTFSGSAFSQIETQPFNSRWIRGDGRYVYARNHLGPALRVFSGYECIKAGDRINRTYEEGRDIDFNYRAYTWGREASGRLGDGGAVDTNQPAPVAIINNNEFVQLSTSLFVSCGVKADKSGWCWGSSDTYSLGYGGIGNQNQPLELSDGFKYKKVIGYYRGSCGLREDKTVWCWGDDGLGQLGNGSITAGAQWRKQKVLIDDVTDFEMSRFTRCAIKENGELWCWGDLSIFGLGNTFEPRKMSTSLKFEKIDIGPGGMCGIIENGEAYCWGSNSNGQIGNGTVGVAYTSPQKVLNIDDFVQISMGSRSACGVRENGEAWCWGSDTRGLLGNGANTYTPGMPSKVSNINDFIKVSVQDYLTACGITSSGLGYCWGSDTLGQLGNGASITSDQEEPSQIEGLTNIVDISCDGAGCAAIVKLDRAAVDSGTSEPVQIYQSKTAGNTVASHGLAVTLDSATLNDEAGIGLRAHNADVTAADTIGAFIGARKSSLTSEASALVFKTNDGINQPEIYLTKDGNLAINTDVTDFSGARLGIGQNTNWLARQYYDGLLIRNNAGTNAAAYYGVNKRTGNATVLSAKELLIQHTDVSGTTINTVADFSSSATPIFYGDINVFGNNKTATIAGYSDTAAARAAFEFLRYRGTSTAPAAVTSGDQLGEVIFNAHDGTSYDADGYVSIKANVTGAVSAGDVPTDLYLTHPDGSATGTDYLQIDNAGKVNIGAASNTTGQINTAGRGAADKAVKAGLDLNCRSNDDEGTIRIYEDEYQYCDGFQWISLVDPKTCVDDGKFISADVDSNGTCAVMSNGQAFCIGTNGAGQVGIGNTTSPIFNAIPITKFKAIDIARSEHHAYAISNTGEVYSWGQYNSIGALGIGLNGSSDVTSPSKVVTNYRYTKINAGYHHACAVRDTGQVDCWGRNNYGQLGNGTLANKSVPTKVKNLGNVIDITATDYHTCALKSDQTAWCWGRNNYGQLGIGTETDHEVIPKQVILTDVIKITTGNGRATSPADSGSSCALRSNGTVWCWGDNNFGQIGNGTSGAANITTPTQVSSITTAIDIASIERAAFALLTDGSIRAWGSGTNGRLGQGSIGGTHTTPTSVSGISNAVKLATSGGVNHMCAILADGSMQCWGGNGQGVLGDGTTTQRTTPVDFINPLSCNSDKIIFGTATNYNGNLGGVDGANAICQMHADRANLPGKYLAFLSDSLGNSPYKNFNRLEAPNRYVRVDGVAMANGWEDLIQGDVGHFRDENGIGFTNFAWTGSWSNGTAILSRNCNNWTSNDVNVRGYMGHLYSSGNWTPISNTNCSSSRPIVCVQQ